MFSSGIFSGNIDDIHKITTEAEIASHYLNIRDIPCVINSPLRKDNKPSMGIYSPNGRDVNFIDFSTGDKGTIFTLLRKIFNMSFEDTLKRIYRDMKSYTANINISKSETPSSVASIKNSTADMQCKIREWRDYDIEYWQSYGISLKWLKYADIYPISHKIIIKDGKRYIFGADKYAYAYVEFKEGKTTLKIYQPYNTKRKWANKHDKSVISLWTKVPKYGDRICICSSVKDALCLWANTGIPSLAIQGEGYTISNTAVSELRSRYKEIYILLDNDEAGLKDELSLSESTGFTNVVLPKNYGVKDISDLYHLLQDSFAFKNIMSELFNNISNKSAKN